MEYHVLSELHDVCHHGPHLCSVIVTIYMLNTPAHDCAGHKSRATVCALTTDIQHGRDTAAQGRPYRPAFWPELQSQQLGSWAVFPRYLECRHACMQSSLRYDRQGMQ